MQLPITRGLSDKSRERLYPQAGSGYLFVRKKLGQDIADNFKRPDSRSMIVDHSRYQKLVWPVLVDDGTELRLDSQGRTGCGTR